MRKYVVLFAVLCFVAVLSAGALFAYARGIRNNGAYVVFAEAVPVLAGDFEYAEQFFLPEYTYNTQKPLYAMCWYNGIFFDAYYQRVILPPHIAVGDIYSENYRQRYTVLVDGVRLEHGALRVSSYYSVPTSVIVEENAIVVYTMSGVFLTHVMSDDGRQYLQITCPREFPYTVVVLDAGHGGRDPGALNVLGRGYPTEADIVLAITHMVLESFDVPGIKLVPTRTEDIFIYPAARARYANVIGDYFISIHVNADARSRHSRGTLTLYGTAEGSHELAQVFNDALVDTLGSFDRGIHYAPQFAILRESEIPVVLLELLFISNPLDAALLSDPEVQREIADTIIRVISDLHV